MSDRIPRKLLDCPEVEELRWPRAFRLLGVADRIEYSTLIHTGYRAWEPYVHRFTSGVTVFAPDRRGRFTLDEAYRPIQLGVADSLYVSGDAGRNAYLREEGEVVDDFELAGPLPEVMAWDLEGRQLIVADERGDVEFVLCDGLLELSDTGMIAG